MCTLGLPNYISQDDVDIQSPILPMSNKSCFDCTSWSFRSLLASSVHADSSLHVKIYQSVPGLLSLSFSEIYSVIEILRDKWLTIPYYQAEAPFSRGMITDSYPSLSMILDKAVPRSFVKWLPGTVASHEILVMAWGTLIFLVCVNEDACIPMGALGVRSSDSELDPIDSLEVSSVVSGDTTTCTVTCRTVKANISAWEIRLTGMEVVGAVLRGQPASSRSEPMDLKTLSSFSTKNYTYEARRGIRSTIEVFRSPR